MCAHWKQREVSSMKYIHFNIREFPNLPCVYPNKINSFHSFCNHYVHRKLSWHSDRWCFCCCGMCLCALLTVVLCSAGYTNKRCAWECSLRHTRHAVIGVCVCVYVCLCSAFVYLAPYLSPFERTVPNLTTLEDWSGPAYPRGRSSSGRSRMVNQPPVCAHKH